jgi:hypothetical protein
MPKSLRAALLIAGALALILALGFFLRLPWVTAIWPVTSSRLSDIFVSSILASIGAAMQWLGLAEAPRGLAGGAGDI